MSANNEAAVEVDEPVCANCMYWARLRFDPDSDDLDDKPTNKGYCRRHAPKAVGWRTWPTTFEADFCGDHMLNVVPASQTENLKLES
jgi:hypothetical protein